MHCLRKKSAIFRLLDRNNGCCCVFTHNRFVLWVFQSDFNVMTFGYANLDSLFILAPWVFLFLVPAVTMRSFAEERRTGTIEMLLTKPLSDWQIVTGKYFAGVVLVIIALLPTLIYYISIYQLSLPVGNVDNGGFGDLI